MITKQYRVTLVDRVKHFGIRKVLKTNPVGRMLFPLVRWCFRLYSVPMKRKRLQTRGADCMRRLHEFLMFNGIEYYCDSGTLLGFVRDHGFIRNDDDIDIAVVAGTISPSVLLKKLLDAGYGYVHAFDYKGEIHEFTVADSSQITIDFYFQTPKSGSDKLLDAWGVYWSPEVAYPAENANSVISYPFLKPTGFKLLDVLGIKVRIPDNEEAVLDSEYPNWRNPDPNFKHDGNVPHTDWPGFAYRLTQSEALAYL